MKVTAIIIFFAIVLSIYTLTNWYIYAKTAPLFVGSFFKISTLKLIFWIIVFAYPVGRILERYIGSIFTTTLIKIGSFWLGAMLYLFLIFLVIDLLRGVNHFLPFTSFLNFKTNPGYREVIVKSVYLITSIMLIVAFINARFPRINQFTITTDKSFGKNEKLRIAAVSDIHLGTIISNKRLNHLVEKINSQNPDIVLLAGDTFDEDIASVINNGLGKYFEQIKAPLGIYAIPGNHEYFGNIQQKIEYLSTHGVTVLRDSTVLINNSFYIAGRDDRSNRNQRKNIGDLLTAIDATKLVILLDHQPFDLSESAKNGIDLQISGHTHHGQLWPFNYITNAIYEVSSGYKKIENTHVIVSNGYGTWGPPMRLGNRPEIIIIDLVNVQ